MSSRRDQVIADQHHEQQEQGASLMCEAHGCPNRWSIDQGNGRLCSWHDRAPASQWPAVTQEQLDAEGDRARSRYLPAPPVPRVDKRDVLQKLAEFSQRMRTSVPSRQWAYDMRERERAGVRLTQAQREMMHGALQGQPEGEP